ncbi:MAG: hypothetical protein VB100_10820 [Angelakisella sp.]|nr:hypothetical protein [Angelakisella sp.]
MTEELLLDTTLDILENNSSEAAYEYLKAQCQNISCKTSQVYNFLYCLAAVSGSQEEALGWIEEAILEKGFWYRPSVWEDDDLASLWNDPRFTACRKISDSRFVDAESGAHTLCTWQKATQPRLALTLHGNQQNMQHSRAAWQPLAHLGWQVEQVQSKTLDSYDLYRWEDGGDGGQQLCHAIAQIPHWSQYQRRMLCGFSAGCGVILDALALDNFACEELLLMAPWIPAIEKRGPQIMELLKLRGIRPIVLCGDKDKDCLPLAQLIAQQAEEAGVSLRLYVLPGLGHCFPSDFEVLLPKLLKKDDSL